MRSLLVTLLIAAAAAPVVADTWRINANDSSYSYVCGTGEKVSLSGNGNVFTVTGECDSLEVNGSDNRIEIEAVATISIDGRNNDVRYERAVAPKKRPAIKLKGAANTVRRREPPATATR